MSDPAKTTGSTSERDPVLEVREHLEQALAALDQLRQAEHDERRGRTLTTVATSRTPRSRA